MQPLNIAIVGLGKQGKEHLDTLLKLEKRGRVKLSGLCDIDEAVIERELGNLRTPKYKNYKDLLNIESIDLLIVSVPNSSHKEIVKFAIKKGVHVLKEKPLAFNLLDANELMNLSSKNGRKLYLVQQRAYHKLFLKLKQILSVAGDIKSYYYKFVLNDNENTWRKNAKIAGGGVWLNMGWHACFLLNWFLGKPDKVSLIFNQKNKYWPYDTEYSATAYFKQVNSNIKIKTILDCTARSKEEKLEIVTERFSIELTRDSLSVKSLASGKVERFTASPSWDDPYYFQLLDVLKKIDSDKEINSKINLDTMKCIESGIVSEKCGKWVDIK